MFGCNAMYLQSVEQLLLCAPPGAYKKCFAPAEKYHQQYLARGGNWGLAQNAEKGATEKIRCYG